MPSLVDPIVIIGATRTPLGIFQGVFSKIKAPILASSAVEAALKQFKINPQHVGSLYMGCALSAGIGQSPARQVVFGSGLSPTVSGTLINKVCGSGLKAVMLASDDLLLNRCPVTIGGGMENMSQAPYILDRARSGYRMGHYQVQDHILLDGLEDSIRKGVLMGVFAEETAEYYGFTRQKQDEFAIQSATLALQAIQNGILKKEISPVVNNSVEIVEDEKPSKIRLDKIPTLKPAFKEGGTVTAANSSSLADGAAAIVLSRRQFSEKKGYKPLAIIRGYATHSNESDRFTTAPVGAIQKLMEQTGWSLSDVDLFEINEAFAVVTMAAIQELSIPRDQVNVLGGACALGHPIGATGARILVTLLNALDHHNLQKGVASLCIGGGEAVAIAIERCT